MLALLFPGQASQSVGMGRDVFDASRSARATFEAAGVNLAKPAITSCGSGVTAAILSLALERIGHRNHALYDGSWAEWGMYDDLAVEKGPQA